MKYHRSIYTASCRQNRRSRYRYSPMKTIRTKVQSLSPYLKHLKAVERLHSVASYATLTRTNRAIGDSVLSARIGLIDPPSSVAYFDTILASVGPTVKLGGGVDASYPEPWRLFISRHRVHVPVTSTSLNMVRSKWGYSAPAEHLVLVRVVETLTPSDHAVFPLSRQVL